MAGQVIVAYYRRNGEPVHAIEKYIEGKNRRIYRDASGIKFWSEEHAEETLKEIQARSRRGTLILSDYTTQAETFERFWQIFIRAYKPGSSTRDKLDTLYRIHFQPFINTNIREISGVHIQQWWIDMQAKRMKPNTQGLSPKYLNDCRQWLLTIFREAKRLQVISAIPPFPKPIKRRRTAVQYLEKEEQVKALLYLPDHDQPIYSFLILSGCRVMEAAALHWEDIDLKGETFTIRRTIDRHGRLGPPKDRDDRPLPLVRNMKALLNVLKRRPVVSIAGHVFLNYWNRHYSYEYLRETWHRACKEAGIPHIPLKNATRASWATQRAGSQNVWLIAQALGHSDIKTTEAYMQAQPEHLRVLFE